MRILVLLSLLFSLVSGCSAQKDYDRTFPLMGTFVSIKTKNSVSAKKSVELAVERMMEVDGVFNRFSRESEVSNINSSGGSGKAGLSDDMCEVLDLSFRLNKMTMGALDVTISPLEEAWGFYDVERKRTLPDAERVKILLGSVGMSKLTFDKTGKRLYFKIPRMKLDFSAVAKGYSVDCAVERLKVSGIKDALIDAGGDIYCLGDNGGKQWAVGIRDPRNRKNVIATIRLSDKAIATSGGYEKFIDVDGRKYPHIIDPATGCPVDNKVLSATVIAYDCATADGLATAFFVLSPDESLDIVEKNSGIECVIICQYDNEVKFFVSSGIKEKIQIYE